MPPVGEGGLGMRKSISLVRLIGVLWVVGALFAQKPSVRTAYRVKQVASGVVYLDGGSNEGLAEGMSMEVTRVNPGAPLTSRHSVGTVTVMAVATNSAVCEVKASVATIQVGDTANLSDADAQALQLVLSSKSVRKYAQVVSFTEGDPIE